MSIIIGIDHGYYAIKTAHCSFPAGLTSYGEHEPYTRQGLLEFGGCFFVCGSGRQPIQRDKTVNDNYYLLTLAAIAKEIHQRGLPPECSVRIAAGLPLTKHTPQSLKNVLSIMYSKEDILFAALKVNPARIDSYCQAVDEPILEEIRKLPSGASMDQLKDRWYQGRDGSDYHYHSSRYRACNMHSVFYHGTIEWRLFNSTLHAGEPVRRKDIPKPNGKTRPLGIPCIWDRLIQQCIKQILEPICEAKFSNNSYGFRPNRSVEHAISRTYSLLQRAHLHYVLEFDIKGFFDNVNHSKLIRQLWSLGIQDKQLLFVIKRILKAPICNTVDYRTASSGSIPGENAHCQCPKTLFGVPWFQNQGVSQR